MPHTLEWYYRDQVIIARFTAPTTSEEISQFDKNIIAMLNESKSTYIHCIMDMSRLQKLPAPKEFRSLTWTSHPKGGWAVMFGLSGVMVFIASIIAQMLRHRWRPLKSENDCIVFLKEIDPKLADWQIGTPVAKVK